MNLDFSEYPPLTSLQNPRIKQVVRLKERRVRDMADTFLIEGTREMQRAIEAEHPLDSLFVCPELFLGEGEEDLIRTILSRQVTLFVCTESVFRKMSYRDRPDGLIAVAPQQHKTLDDLIPLKTTPLFVVAEAIEKPGNLGSILRSSDAVGIDALIVCDRCTDVHNPNVVRASTGTLFTVPVVEAQGKEILNWLKQQGIAIVAATPSAEMAYTEADFSGPIAIAVGTEKQGLSQQWLEQADINVRIPMCGAADSLNVAMATTLLLYEVLRQRSSHGNSV